MKKTAILMLSFMSVAFMHWAYADLTVPYKFEKGKAPKASEFNKNFQALSDAVSGLQEEAAKKSESNLASLPKGIILAWYAKEGKVPNGWAVCDGTSGTPDLRNRFLQGVATFADVGIDSAAQGTHNHSASGSFSGTTVAARKSKPDGWRVRERSAPHATGVDHTHGFSGSVASTTNDVSHIPPNAKVIFIMKVR